MTYLNGIVHIHKKIEKKKYFGQLVMFDMCTRGDTAHIDTIFKFLAQTRVNMGVTIFFTAAMIRGFRSTRSCRRIFCVLCTKCTLHSNHSLTRVIFQHTKRIFSPGAAIFSLHTLASTRARNVKYDEKQLTGKKFLTFSFYLYRLRKHVSYGFPIINFCNPGVHYETPCIVQWLQQFSDDFHWVCYHTSMALNTEVLINP